MVLTANTLSILNSASSNRVQLAMHRIASNFNDEHWFHDRHPYRVSPNRSRYAQIKLDLKRRRANDDEMAEFISVSAPTHALDGWSLLGRSVDSLLKGDPYSAVHLAYYAELRAAIAILASDGIGIFDRIHCILDYSGNCQRVFVKDRRRGILSTHQCTWAVFEWWANYSRSIDFLRRVIKPDRNDLGTWLDATTNSYRSFPLIGAKWLKLWGLDVERFSNDRSARNDVSYWPNTINGWSSRSTLEHCIDISEMWSWLEPEPESRFASLDRHLLRNVLFDDYIAATGQKLGSNNFQNGFGRQTNMMLRNLGIVSPIGDNWHNFFMDLNLGEPQLITLAGKRSKTGANSHVLEVISRAIMLLRLATGAAANLLFDAGIRREDVAFWVNLLGVERGLWTETDEPEELHEMWSDVEDEIDNWDGMRHAVGLDAHTLKKSHSGKLTILSEYEKVGLWGLGL